MFLLLCFVLILNRRGELTGLGRKQTENWTQRVVKRLSTLFNKALHGDQRRRVRMISTSSIRVRETREVFVQNLSTFMSSSIVRELDDPDILTVHLNDPIYQPFIVHGKQVHEKIQSISMQPKSKILKKQILQRFYESSFIDRISLRKDTYYDDENDVSLNHQADAVMILHNLFLPSIHLQRKSKEKLLFFWNRNFMSKVHHLLNKVLHQRLVEHYSMIFCCVQSNVVKKMRKNFSMHDLDTNKISVHS